ncbi:hypothetical protein PHYPSEUDO_005445 [Phytophthora pseudosyringae]|uniref:Uncharacterized protein n=1 Tax=Phytophthora pseudosyringae TaxID=221518 RepID=A0A8T1VNX9_9STRA|nr:hypothetical protein PHYPSEUDO_005445 [Phytophthora pseudosyringae]
MTPSRVTEEERGRTCSKCGKVLANPLALQKHLNKVFLCDRKGVRRNKRDMGISGGVHRCRRCLKALSSAHALRSHMTKATPCDARQSASHHPVLMIKRKVTALTSHKSFSSQNPLANSKHKVFDQDTVSETLNFSKPGNAPPMEGSLDEYLSRAAQDKEERRQLRQKRLEARRVITRRDNSEVTTTKPAFSSLPFKRKRSTEDNRAEMSPIDESSKRVRSKAGSFAALAAKISTRDSSPRSHQGNDTKPVDTTSTTNSSAREPKPDHGGNILTDGCCCRQCVRKWTRKMMNRLKFLGDEVTSLQRLVQRGQSAELGAQPSTMNPHPSDKRFETDQKVKREFRNDATSLRPTESMPSQDLRKEHPNPASLFSDKRPSQHSDVEAKVELQAITTSTSGYAGGKTHKSIGAGPSPSTNDPVKTMLTDKYNRLNDQIITNEKALEDSVAYLKEISPHDEVSSSELRTQLDELRVYIDVEKGKRAEAVAAIIAHRWNSKRAEFRLVLENLAVKSKLNAEKAFHEDCAEIANQLEEKNEVLSKLGDLIGMNTENSSWNEVPIPKYAVERTAKIFLERERDDIFMCLLRSSPRIYLLTKEKLGEAKKVETL